MSLEAWGDGPEDPYWNGEEVGEIASNAFRQGAQAMREKMAQAFEARGDHAAAKLIREEWLPAWGDDPGKPSEVVSEPDW